MKSWLVWPLMSATVIRVGACLPVVPGPDPTPDPVDRVTLNDGFESGLVNWTQDEDVPNDPNNNNQPVAATVALSTEQAFEGTRSAKFTLDGRQADGTLWLEHLFTVVPRQAYRVRLSFAVWSPSPSDNLVAQVAGYIGTERPRREEDFDVTQAANQVGGWKQYQYVEDVATDATGRIYTAMGINAVFETETTYYIDDVRVTLDPL